jgi:UDP-glucose:(heptosyl)LPS alpha-1,3-glucosyltransferase
VKDSTAESSMKIALVRPFFTLAKGGAERYAVELARALIASGHEVHLFAHEWDRPELKGVGYHQVPMALKPGWLRVLTFQWYLRRALDGSDYDVVLGMTPFTPQRVFWLGDGLYRIWTRVAWPNALRRWLMCAKRAVMLVNLWLERRIMSGGAEDYIVNSRLVKKQAMTEYGVPEERISLVYPGVDLSRFHVGARAQWRAAVRQNLGITEDEIVFLFVANNFRRKGLDLVLRALQQMDPRQAHARLLVVGAGRTWLFRRLASLLGLSDRVTFVGSSQEVEKYYSAADVFVLPTRYDPFAAVCLEAMASGLPVITTKMNGAAELIQTGQSGFVVNPAKSKDSLAHAMRFFLARGRCAAAGQMAAQTAKEFSRQAHIKQMIATLRQIAARRAHAIKVVEPERGLLVNQAFLPMLEAHRLASYAALMEARGARRVEYNRGKQIHLFRLEDAGRQLTLYLKRYASRQSWRDVGRRLMRQRVLTEGVAEWNKILALRAGVIPTMTPVAAGERFASNGRKESFVLTEGLDDHVPVDEYVAERFGAPLDTLRVQEKHRLIAALARLTRQLHWSGFNHRDYYLCHLFAPVNGLVERLRIIDLQRVGYRMTFRARWISKDLAALHYSSQGLPLSDWDRLRFYALYSRGEPKLKRRLRLRWVLRKAAQIARHDQNRRQLDSPAKSPPPAGTAAKNPEQQNLRTEERLRVRS